MCKRTRKILKRFTILILVIAFQLQCFAADLFSDGMVHVRSRDFRRAKVCFEKAAEASPNNPALWMNIGNCHAELGEYTEAIANYQLSIKKGGLNSDVCSNLSGAYQKLGRNKEAYYWLNVACRLDSSLSNDPGTKALLKKLQDPLSNPPMNPASSDYLSELSQVHKWTPTELPLKVYIQRNSALPIVYNRFKTSILDGLDQWCEATNGRISYRVVDQIKLANLVCSYTDDPTKVKSSQELGADSTSSVHIATANNSIDWATIRILVGDKPGGILCSTAELRKLSLHELGHALGLHGHSSNNHDVMFFTANIPTVSANLSERDKRTIMRLYGQKRK